MNIPFDTSIIPEFEQRLAYWAKQDAEDPSNTLETNLCIILSEEIESISRFMEISAGSVEDPKILHTLLTSLRGFIDEHVPGGLEAFNQHYWKEVEQAKAKVERRKALRAEREAETLAPPHIAVLAQDVTDE